MRGVVCGVGVRQCRVGRPFSGGRRSHVARRAGGDRRRARRVRASGAGASGAGDAVNGKYEKKTVNLFD